MARRPIASIRTANESARAAFSRGVQSAPSDPDHLGDLTWWDPVNGWRASVDRVADAFRAAGLDPATTLPAPPDWSVAFGRAVAATRASVREKHSLIDAAAGPKGERRVAIVRVERDAVVRTEDEGTVFCPKDGTRPFVERADPNGIAADIVATAGAYFERYTSDDIRTAFVDALERWGALPCRAQAPHVVYWLPSAGGQAIRAFADAVESLAWGRIELFAGYASDPRSKRAAVNAVNEGLEARLSAFASDCDKYAAADPAKTRSTTIANKLADAKRLREQAALYRTILGAAVTSIDDRVQAIETTLASTLGAVTSARSSAA